MFSVVVKISFVLLPIPEIAQGQNPISLYSKVGYPVKGYWIDRHLSNSGIGQRTKQNSVYSVPLVQRLRMLLDTEVSKSSFWNCLESYLSFSGIG